MQERRQYAFEGFDVLLSRLADAVRILDHELEAVGLRGRRSGVSLEEEEAAREEVEGVRPRHRRAREWVSEHER